MRSIEQEVNFTNSKKVDTLRKMNLNYINRLAAIQHLSGEKELIRNPLKESGETAGQAVLDDGTMTIQERYDRIDKAIKRFPEAIHELEKICTQYGINMMSVHQVIQKESEEFIMWRERISNSIDD